MIKAKKNNSSIVCNNDSNSHSNFFGLILDNGVNTNNKYYKEFTIVNKPQDNKWRPLNEFNKMKKDLM